MRRCLFSSFFLSLLFAIPVPAQSGQQVETHTVTGNRAPATQPLSAEETKRNQQHARELLTTAELEAKALEAPGRALTLMQIGNALSGLDPAKASAVLKDAFVATTEMDPAKAGYRSMLQDRIFEGLLALAPEAIPELLAQAEPRSRSRALGRLIQRAVQKKDYGHAVELVNQVAAEPGPFPYDAVSTLMMNLPAENNGDRLNAFTQALTAYQRDPNAGRVFGGIGFDRMVVRFGTVLPQATVMNAVDEILKRGKESDESASFSLSSSAGSVTLNSVYDYYLFELLPTIRHWDPGRADDLVKENAALRQTMQQFPNGVQSIDPSIRDTPPKPGEPSGMRMSMSSTDKNGNGGSSSNSAVLPSKDAAVQQVRAQYDAEVARILKDAAKNPGTAMQRANALPEQIENAHPRIDALSGIATACVKDQPAATRDALGEMVKLVIKLKPEEQRGYLVTAANLYVKAEDKEAAKRTIAAGVKVAEALYEADHNPDSPNEALKGYWPSTNAWSLFVMLAQKVSPELAQEIMGGIKDEEIRTSVHIAYAVALGGSRPPQNTVMVSRGNNESMWTFDSPQ